MRRAPGQIRLVSTTVFTSPTHAVVPVPIHATTEFAETTAPANAMVDGLVLVAATVLTPSRSLRAPLDRPTMRMDASAPTRVMWVLQPSSFSLSSVSSQRCWREEFYLFI